MANIPGKKEIWGNSKEFPHQRKLLVEVKKSKAIFLI